MAATGTREVDALLEERRGKNRRPADSFEEHSLYRAAFP